MSFRSQLRFLGRARSLTAGVVVTLAIGTGVLITTFGIVDAALFRQPPFPDAPRLAILYVTRSSARQGITRERWSYPRVQLLRSSVSSFERTASFSRAALTLSGSGDPEEVQGEIVAPAYFPLLGVGAERGRTFAETDDVPADPEPVILLGHDLWMRRYGGDPSIVGRALRVNGVALIVVGVLPPEFRGLSGKAELWVPTAVTPRVTYAEYLTTNQSFISVVGKLRQGVGLTEARAELRTLGARINEALPVDPAEPDASVSATAVSLNEARVDRRTTHSLLVLGGAVLLLHLLACANVTSLLLGFATARRREMGMRLALGSSPARLARTVLGEGLLLATIGCALGLALAALASTSIVLPPNTWGAANFYGSVAAFDMPSFGWRSLVFGVVLAAVTAVLVCSAPVFMVLRENLATALRDGGRSASASGIAGRRPSARGLIVALEAALAMVLLVGAGLLIDSFARMRRTDLGVDAENVLTFMIRPSDIRVPPADAPTFITRVLGAITRVPGVIAATVDGGAPVSGSARSVLYIMGRPASPPNEAPPVLRHYVAPDHFRTLGIPLLRGRTFTSSDVAGQPRVAIISQSAARRFWPDQDPIGQRVWFGGGSNFNSPDSSAEIVGIVGDVVNEPLDRHPNPSSFYTPYAQFTYSWRMVFVRTAGDPLAAVPAIRKSIGALESDLPMLDVMPLTDLIGSSWSRQRMEALLFGGFAAAGLLLAAIGIYAVVAYAVSQRTREMGIRLALGAPRGAVLRLVVREGMTLPLVGLIVGSVAAILLAQLLRASLYGITPTDPRVFGATIAVLVLASAAACGVPALRATRVDPLVALRAD